MSREIASCHIEHYPDLMTCFQGGTNRREREEYRRSLSRHQDSTDTSADSGHAVILLRGKKYHRDCTGTGAK